ncbi:hypothetical protein KKQ11_13450 [Pseudomonas sp. MG-2]|uniref:hypothetical protein n=1 Tax=Pseudomonas sp. MG-2 TaxID=405714 RepID=UPI001BFFDEBC|nr:hypothetical protein [Pseudomonas sp. MG-2]MBT9236842.1 hypothetical protein [Pseudomonas sp. MG-2]
MIPHTGWLRRQLESALILLAAWIIGGRNVTRSGVVSRRDNNDMYAIVEKLEDIAERIADGYPKP